MVHRPYSDASCLTRFTSLSLFLINELQPVQSIPKSITVTSGLTSSNWFNAVPLIQINLWSLTLLYSDMNLVPTSLPMRIQVANIFSYVKIALVITSIVKLWSNGYRNIVSIKESSHSDRGVALLVVGHTWFKLKCNRK